MLTLLNDNVADKSPVDWKIGRKELVAARHEDIWYRAMAVKKSGGSFHCFLLDFGGLVQVAQDNLRPLNEAFYQLPPYAYQVCLAGFGPEEGTQFTQEHAAILREFFTADPDYKFVAKFLGQAEGGRWLVNLRGKDDGESVADLLIEGGMGVARKDEIAVTMEKFLEQEARTGGDDQDTSTTSTEVEVIHATAAPAVIKAADASTAPPSPVTGPVVPRGSLKPGSNDECAGVCYFTSPDLFYTCSTDIVDLFPTILSASQDAPAGPVNPVPGTCCLALDEGSIWYRAEILELTTDKTSVKLYLIDYGKEIESSIVKLKPLPDNLKTQPGLVVKIQLRGIKPSSSDQTWSEDEKEGGMLVLDVGGETMFKLKNVEHNEAGDGVWADMEDFEGNDIAKFMVDTQCAVFEVDEGNNTS